jgi:hypothetical protein
LLISPLFEQILSKRNQPGELIVRVNVFLDDIESEIVKPAKTPDDQCQQKDGFPIRVVDEEQTSGDGSDEQEEDSFQFDPKQIRQIFHANRLKIA